MYYRIEEHRLKYILKEAYQAGWYGSKEMKDAAIEELMALLGPDKEIPAGTVTFGQVPLQSNPPVPPLPPLPLDIQDHSNPPISISWTTTTLAAASGDGQITIQGNISPDANINWQSAGDG